MPSQPIAQNRAAPSHPTTVFDVYEFYLSADDLTGPTRVTIQAATARPVFDPREKAEEIKIVLRFVKGRKVMALNKTQAESLAEIAQSPVFSEWAGLDVVLTPTQLRKDQKTIEITAAPPHSPTPKAPPGSEGAKPTTAKPTQASDKAAESAKVAAALGW